MSVERVRYDLTVYKGNDFKMFVYFKDDDGVAVDITSWTGYAQVREEKKASGTLIASFTVTIAGALGKVTMELADTDTSPDGNKGFYDLLMVDDAGFDETYIEGLVTFVETETVKV
jgi:hypothetical protein